MDAADQLANLSENEAIWDRIEKARIVLDDEEKNKMPPLKTVNEDECVSDDTDIPDLIDSDLMKSSIVLVDE